MKIVTLKPLSKNSDVLTFLFKVLLWMPVTFAIWYFVAPAILYVSAICSDFILSFIADHVIKSVAANSREIIITTQFNNADFSIKAMNYAYSFPFLLAMILASPDSIVGKLKKYSLSLLPLFLIVIWGVCFHAVSTIAFYAGPEIAQKLNSTSTIRLVLSLGFQLGKLIIPPLTPIILWLFLYRDYANTLVPRLISAYRDGAEP